MARVLTIPTPDWSPRPHQLPFMKAFNKWGATNNKGQRKHEGVNSSILVHHRQSGKDEQAQWALAKAVMNTPGGRFVYAFPTFADLRGAMWKEERLKKMYPKGFITKMNQSSPAEIHFANGAVIDGWGFDNPRLGSTIDGIVVSEFSLCDFSVWGYVEPMLLESDGWSLFIGTPRGPNHFHDMYFNYLKKMEDGNPNFFASLVSCTDTGLVSLDRLQNQFDILKSTMGRKAAYLTVLQEYFCSWEGGDAYAIYSEEMMDVMRNRLIELSVEPNTPINCAWDVATPNGGDYTVCVVYQVVKDPEGGNPYIFILDYAWHNRHRPHSFMKWMERNNYTNTGGEMIMPWDWKSQYTLDDDPHREALEWGFELHELTNRTGAKWARAQMCRKLLGSDRTFFSTKCNEPSTFGLNETLTLTSALRQYKEKWNDEKQKSVPIPGQVFAHFADAVGHLAMGHNNLFYEEEKPLPIDQYEKETKQGIYNEETNEIEIRIPKLTPWEQLKESDEEQEYNEELA